MDKVWIYDWETYKPFACVTFYNAYKQDEFYTFIISDERKDNKKIVDFVKGKILLGYNSKTFDDIITNYVFKHPRATSRHLYQVAQKIINTQRRDDASFYKDFKDYLNNPEYRSIDLMRLLFSKKLRVGLKELECSLNHGNVEELPYPFDSEELTKAQKDKIVRYNINDCEATKKVFQKSEKALKLRKWMQTEYGIDAYSLDGVNAGVKILEVMYEQEIGNSDFKKQTTRRNTVEIKDIILPLVKFDTPEFNAILERYKKHTWYSAHLFEKYGDKKMEMYKKVSGLKFEPTINDFKFKFSLGGLHGYTKSKTWESKGEYEVISVDVASYYPSEVLKWGFVPAHLDTKIFLKIYQQVKDERIAAKKSGDDMKNETLKLSINGTFGNFGNQYSWLFDHKVRLQICVNGQLMLAMLIEKLFAEGIELIDANTDGVYVYLHNSKKEKFAEIVKWWEGVTRMEMEQTKFEKMWFLTTADYFGTYYDKGKLKTKEKGMFISEVQVGKGMEFPIIAKSVKDYFLEDRDFRANILAHDNILDFCSYKKLKRDSVCLHNNVQQQRVNRFYACKSGAYLYRKKWDEKRKRFQTDHLLKESPVILYNKFDDKKMDQREINYGFYISQARQIVNAMEGDKQQIGLWA